jgi:hypothetical protein
VHDKPCADIQANASEQQLTDRLNAISSNLHLALRTHSKHAHEDVALALLENARLTIGFHKHVLRELESLKPDIARIGTNAPIPVAKTAAAPLPSLPAPTTQPSMVPSQPYGSLVRPPPMDTSKSMFLPPHAQHNIPRPNSAGPPQAGADPLAGHMAQSMMLPGQGVQRVNTTGRAQGRKLDEKQAAKLLAGGF